MAQVLTLTGANIVLFINNKKFNAVQSITFTVDYGEQSIYGIDAPYPQDIGITKITVSGNVQAIRTKQSGGLQGINARPLFTDYAAAPYISLRIQDRLTQEDILFIPNAKISNETHAISTKNTYKLSFSFIGQIPLFALDRS